jgi:carbamoyl-phosphate synthase large subunit
MKTRVLVTGAGALLGQGIMRAIRSSGKPAEIIAVDPSPLSAGLYWADGAHLIPMASSPDYMPRLREILDAERPQVVLVGTDVELLQLARHRRELEADFDLQVLVSSLEVVSIADDKYRTYEFLKANGFPFADTVYAEDAQALVERVGFPLIVKPRVGARSVGVSRVNDQAELDEALSKLDDALVQAVAGPDDQEYTAGVVCFDGVCNACIVMRRELRDGNTYRACVEDSEDLTRQVRALAEALNPHGPVNIQFRVDDRNRVRVFEINARFSGTTPLRAKAGFDEVQMCLDWLIDGVPVVQPTIEKKIFLRHWSETVICPADLIRSTSPLLTSETRNN